MISIHVGGKKYERFTSATATKQMDTASGSFSFVAVTKNKLKLPIKIGDSCEVYADDNKIITGFIEGITGSYDSNNHNVQITGRDKTADFIDSTIDVITLNAPVSLKRAIEKIIDQVGADIDVIQNVTLSDFKSAEDLVSASVGEGAFEFATKLARKKQALINVNGDGNFVIDRSSTKISNAQIRHQIVSNNNNVKSASWDYNDTERFSRYKSVSQLNFVASEVAGILSSDDLTNQQSNVIVDERIRKSRQLIFQSENLSSEEAAIERTKWEANIRKTRGRIYSCVVQSFYVDEIFLKPNMLIRVIDDFAEINDVMLLNSVQYASDPGDSMLLSFVDKESYTLSLEEPQEVGGSFFA